MIGGHRMDVVSEAEFIDRDTDIEVAAVDGVKILVKKA